MEKRIAIVGSGSQTSMLIEKILSERNISVVSAEKEKSPFINEPESYVLTNPYAQLETSKDNFICKGKHKYRKVGEEEKKMSNGSLIKDIWQCECGRKL